MFEIFVVSDGTGRTAQQALSAALTQFPTSEVNLTISPGILTKEQVQIVVNQASLANGFIVHTIVSENLRKIMVRESRRKNVECIDLMGGLLSRLSEIFANAPSEKPGLFQKLNEEYFQRIDAIQFAFNHDDGQRYEELHKAEIVLLGVSRTFKTPLSIYFAFKGWLVANVPIVYGIDPPEEIFKIPHEKVFCLTTNASRLSALRVARHEFFGGNTGSYADPVFVAKELQYAHTIYKRQPNWPIINVTSKPIEEIATEILAIKEKSDKE